MTERKTQGVFVKSNRTFYYLETGNIVPRSSLDRVRSLLIQRELISYHRPNITDIEPDHKIMTLGEAQDLNLELEAIYLNKHIEAQVKAQDKKQQATNPWRK